MYNFLICYGETPKSRRKMETYKKTDKKNYNILKEVPLNIRREYAKIILKYGKPNQKILDAGFGSGSILIPLAEQNHSSKIYGIDYSKLLFNSVSKEINEKAKLYLMDIMSHKSIYDIVHFKAILHCFNNPEKILDKLTSLVKPNGLIITAHENSQVEDRIEQIFNHRVDDRELELLLEYYFMLRDSIGKTFVLRKYPAGNCRNAVKYLCKKRGFKVIRKIQSKKLYWNRKFRLADLIYSIKNRTYKVFDENITDRENKIILNKMLRFSRINKINLKKNRFVSANFEIYILKNKNSLPFRKKKEKLLFLSGV